MEEPKSFTFADRHFLHNLEKREDSLVVSFLQIMEIETKISGQLLLLQISLDIIPELDWNLATISFCNETLEKYQHPNLLGVFSIK